MPFPVWRNDSPSTIDSFRYVVEQLQCLGILQTCEVLKVGMPTRVTYTELKEVSPKKTVVWKKVL